MLKKWKKLSAALSKYYRYVTRTGKESVSLLAEFEHMKNYLTIQKIRFEDRVCIEIEELPEVGSRVEAPRLILQPIVENAYKYVFEHVEKEGKLKVCTEESETFIRIFVEDSGYERKEEAIARIWEALKEEGVHITGLGNLQKRLRLMNPENEIRAEYSGLGGMKIILTVMKRGDDGLA